MIGTTVSHYKILEKLGEGGMGVVYKAHDTKLDRTVALKFLPHELISSAEDHARFLQEARAASALNHPNICAIHALGEHEGLEFIDMEFIEGKTLRKQIPVAKLEDAISFAIQIAEALQEAHSKGIVHRDIKTDNIMVTAKNQIKVLDFGLAKLKGSLKHTRTSSTVGTLAYMAPEQIQGGEVDARSDIFSFGVVLFEMLAGHTPFRGDHEPAMMYSILNEEPEFVQNNRQDISPDIDRIIHRALEKDPEDRYQHIDDMVSELRKVQKQSSRVSRALLRETPIRQSGGKTPETREIDYGLSGSRGTNHSPKRTRHFVVLGVIFVVVLLAGFIGYVSFFGRHQPIDSIAVLPFENVGADLNTEYLSDGITESLINTLSQLSNLSVMSSSSVFHFKGKAIDPQKAGKELGVKAVLRGRVTQRGDNLQISTELVDVSNNTHIWGEQYNKKLSDVLAVQEEISKSISRQLSLKLVGEDEKKLTKHPTDDIEAYQLYLKGKFHWNKRKADDLQKAVDYFNRAIEKDPSFALAYAGLASTYTNLPDYSALPVMTFIPKAETAARKALELDATLAEPHAVLGMIKEFEWDWKGAEKELERAMELDPNYPTAYHWYCNSLEQQGRFEEALSAIKRAQELDPLSPVITVNVGEVLFYMQRYDLAIEQLNKSLELDPNFTPALDILGELYAQQDRFDEAISVLQRIRQILGANNPYAAGDLGYVYAKAGKEEEAIYILNQLIEFSKKKHSVSVQIARVYAGLGDRDKAFAWLEKGYDEKDTQLGFLKVDHFWDNLRSDSRYTALLKKIGLDK